MSSKNPKETSVSLDDIKQALGDGQPSEAFCKYWDQAKALLQELLTQIGDTNPMLTRCIKGVIAAGDAYSEKCPQ